MKLTDDLAALKGVGPAMVGLLGRLGLRTVHDLITYYPRRYDDYSLLSQINQLKPGTVSIAAKIKQVRGRYVRRGMHVTEAIASDQSGSVRLVWFNQPYRSTAIKPDTDYFVSGMFELSHQRLAIMNPNMELASDFPVNTARIVPIYRETKGLKSNQIRRLVRTAAPVISGLPETLPRWVIEKEKLMPRGEAILAMHFPADAKNLSAAQRRLGFEEVFELSLASLLSKRELSAAEAMPIPFNQNLAKEFVSHLPFKLTDDQRKVVWRIYQDMGQTSPMNRLVEGDVGSGKTVVAAMAALMAMEQNHQVALMAPTELLARQHAETLFRLLEPLGYADQVGLLVGSLKPKQKEIAKQRIADGDVRLIVGTHALIQTSVAMPGLRLVVVDEQHRFGVEQRKTLQAKAGHALHVLSLSATPIPRSLALTLYGEMDISILATKPAGRKPIRTKICSPNSRKTLYATIVKELVAGRQMFIVTPQIVENEITGKSAAETTFKDIKRDFSDYTVGLLHGKLPATEKVAVMEQFVRGELRILVATTVIEVGVDVPNATVMLIENADSFGLAQIHQLRGRVGRSDHQGFCYLMMSDSKAPNRRLRALESSSDGFALAELDLKIRGPGAIYGQLQHGALDLRVAKLTDTKLIVAARESAESFLNRGENLLHYPGLQSRINSLQAVTNLN